MNLSSLLQRCQDFASQELLGVAIASTILCLCGMIGAALMRRRNAASRFWILQMAGTGVLLACLLLVGTSGIPLRYEYSTTDDSIASVAGDLHELAIQAPMPDNATNPLETFDSGALNRTNQQENRKPIESQSNQLLPTMNSNTDVTNRASVDPPLVTIGQRVSTFLFERCAVILVSIWSVVFAVNLIWFVYCISCCYRIVFQATEIKSSPAVDALNRTYHRMGGDNSRQSARRGQAQLLVSDRISVPFTIGILTPKIVLPSTFESWSTEKLEMVIAHELAHIQRHDVLWHWLNRLACCVTWFNPLVWIAARHSIIERERACDDRVIQSGIAPTEYGRILVEIAAMASGHPLLAGSVSMAEPPLKQRLHRILSPTTTRRRSSTRFRILVTMIFVALTIALGVIRPLAVASSNTEAESDRAERVEHPGDELSNQMVEDYRQDDADDDDEVKKFKMVDSLTGSILTHDGQPVVGATVEMKMYRYTQQPGQYVEVQEIGKWKTTTEANGIYLLNLGTLAAIPVDTRLFIYRVSGPAIVESRQGTWSAKEISDLGRIEPFKLRQGREITGQIVNSDQQATPAIIRAAGSVVDPNLGWFSHPIETDKNGKFTLIVPVDYQIELMAIAPGYVPQRIFVPGNEVRTSSQPSFRGISLEELKVINGMAEDQPEPNRESDNDPFDAGKIMLSQGSIVKGKLLDGESQPIAGVVVGLETAYDTKLKGMAFDVSFASVTDDQGQFEFPPATGRSYVFVAESVYASNQIEGRRVTGKSPPRINPIEFVLDGKTPTQQVTLNEITATQTVSGTIKFDDGRPAVNVEVKGGARPNVKFGSVFTDEKGNYEIELPRPLVNGHLRVLGARDARGVWNSPVGFRTSTGQVGDINFDRLDGDEEGVNWSLRVLKTFPFDDSDYENARKEFIQLRKLRQSYSQQFDEAMKDAKTPEEEEVAYMELDPRNVMIQHYLAFEEKYRGKRAAFLAINACIGSAGSVAGSETEVAKGRNEMISRVNLYYLDHKDLPTVFDNFAFGLPTPYPDEIIEMAMKHSPHRKVRAQAILYRAEHAMKNLRQAEMLPFYRESVKQTIEMADVPTRLLEDIQHRIIELEAIDQDVLRAAAIRWLDVIDAEYSDVRIDSQGSHYNQQLSTITPRLRFALTKIITGKPAPEITATDINGTPIRLSQLRGKPVVLMLCFDHGSKLDGQLLAKKYADQPVEFLTIVGEDNLEEFKKKYPRDEIAGAIAIEHPFQGRIRGNWCVNSGTTFLIDKDGILQVIDSPEEVTEKWLKQELQ